MLYNKLKSVCETKGISISQLEKTLEFPRGSIYKWNENEPGIRKVKKVADHLNVSIESLLDDTTNTVPKED